MVLAIASWSAALALGVSIATLFLALLVMHYDSAGDLYFQEQLAAAGRVSRDAFAAEKTAYAATERYAWLPPSTGIDVRFSVGLDGLSLWMYGLSALLMVSSVLVSWTAIEEESALFYCMLLLLENGCWACSPPAIMVLFYVSSSSR